MRLMKAETWLDAAAAVEAGFADRIDEELALAARVSAKVLQYKRTPLEVRAMAKSSSRTPEQRARLRRRLQLIAMQARFGRDPKRDEEDRERGARQRRRYEMQAMVEAVKADARKEDAAERAANVERQRQRLLLQLAQYAARTTLMTTTTENVLELARSMYFLSNEVDELRAGSTRSISTETGLIPSSWPRSSPARLGPELGAARRAMRCRTEGVEMSEPPMMSS